MKDKTIKCSCCHKNSLMPDTFFFEEKAYCMNCLFSLIMDMIDSGNINANMNNCEENGIMLSF